VRSWPTAWLGYAEEDDDIALGQALLPEVLSSQPGPGGGGVGTKLLGLLAGLPGLGQLISQGRVQDGHDLQLADVAGADAEV